MVTWENVKSFCLENLNLAEEKRNHQIHARCPFCGDSKRSAKKKRLWVKQNPETNEFYFLCYNCNEAGSFYKLYGKVKNISEIQAEQELTSIDKSFYKIKESFKKTPPIKIIQQSIPVTFNWILDYCFKEGESGYVANNALKRLKEFRKERKIPDDIKLFIGYRDEYVGRVIIPIYNEDGDVVYFQARSLAKNPIKKYINPPSEKIIEQDLTHHKEPIIITEGIIDSLMVPEHGVPCLGSFISDEFLEKLFKKFNNIIIALDNDEGGFKGLNRLLSESRYLNRLKFFFMPDKFKNVVDLNQLKMTYDNINIINLIVENSVSAIKAKILLKWRG